MTGCHKPENGRRRVVVDRHTKEPDLPVALQLLDGLEPVAAIQPVVGQDVELLEIDCLQSEIAKALIGALDDPVGRERLIRRDSRGRGPDPILRRNLRRDDDWVARRRAPHDRRAFAVPGSVTESGIKEVHSEFDRTRECAERIVIVGSEPACPADPPSAVADLGDGSDRSSREDVAAQPNSIAGC